MEEIIVDIMCFVNTVLEKGDRALRESIDNPKKIEARCFAEGTCDTCHKILEFIISRYDMYSFSSNQYDNIEKSNCQVEGIQNEMSIP